MSDDLKTQGADDRSRININDPAAVAYWTKELGVSAFRLREAVQAVGSLVDEVRAFLRARKV